MCSVAVGRGGISYRDGERRSEGWTITRVAWIVVNLSMEWGVQWMRCENTRPRAKMCTQSEEEIQAGYCAPSEGYYCFPERKAHAWCPSWAQAFGNRLSY